MNPLDTITLTGLRATAFHGALPEERRTGQPFVIDVAVQLRLADAAASDDLDRTIHYGILAEEVVAAVESDPVDLIETVAERVAGVVLAHEAAIFVTVTVHKPEAPITVPFADVSVTVHRGRPERLQQASSEHDVVLALGSNLGDREGTIRAAVADLRSLPGLTLTAASHLIETPALTPTGVDEEAPAYLNAVVRGSTTLAPVELLREVNRIERAHGRVRDVRWGDRTLDIDIIAMGDTTLYSEILTVPHPRAAERVFVLTPWLEIEPDAVVPGHGRVDELLHALLADTGTDTGAEPPVRFAAEPLL